MFTHNTKIQTYETSYIILMEWEWQRYEVTDEVQLPWYSFLVFPLHLVDLHYCIIP